jgi:hypothetical protein
VLKQLFEQEMRTLGALGLDDRGKCVHPFARLLTVQVVRGFWERFFGQGRHADLLLISPDYITGRSLSQFR